MTDIDALIERLRDWRWPEGPMEDDALAAADALAKLRDRDNYCDDAFRYYEESLDQADAEMARLREALETYIKLNSGGHVHIDDLKKARAALGWK